MASTGPSSSSPLQTNFSQKIFNAFLFQNQLSLSEEELYKYAKNELKMDVPNLPPVIKENLPLILVTYMNIWSGWKQKSQLKEGKFSKEYFFFTFHNHMKNKMQYIVRNISKLISDEEINVAVNFSPFVISLKCPAEIVNTIIFSHSGNDVIMKEHRTIPWKNLSPSQLINWPYVEVTFESPDICIVRRQETDFLRYLNILPYECKRIDNCIIEHVQIVNESSKEVARSSFTYRFLLEYSKEYLLALKQVKSLSSERLEEIHTILYHFLEDVKHINVNESMATNTAVLFKLCTEPFIRKKLVKTSDPGPDDGKVAYCEIITPKVKLLLLFCRAKQLDEGSVLNFELPSKILNSLHTEEVNNYLPSIAYSCTFCNVSFGRGDAKRGMLDHLLSKHQMEQHVRCTACKKQFDVASLAASRWRHKCMPPTQNAPEIVNID